MRGGGSSWDEADDTKGANEVAAMELLPQNLFLAAAPPPTSNDVKGHVSPLGFHPITAKANGHFNYQPLLENLRPIRRTEEIVRLRNDGGSIAVIETTDEPGRKLVISF